MENKQGKRDYGIRIIYEDNHLLVVEKPANVLSQGDETGDPDMLTLLKQDIKERYNKPGEVYLGLVHRLDRPVGGVMVFAKTSKAASRLSDQIRRRTFQKTYLAVVHGKLPERSGMLKHYLVKNENTNTVKVVDRDNEKAMEAVLDYDVLDTSDGLSLVKINLHTGRPHQIRVQFSAIGNSLYGDQKYGKNLAKPGQQIALWSARIVLNHPTRKIDMTFECNPPDIHPWNKFDIKGF